jgi:hypothetical protein
VLAPSRFATVLALDATVAPDVLAVARTASVSVTAAVELASACVSPQPVEGALLASLQPRASVDPEASPVTAAVDNGVAQLDLWRSVDLTQCDARAPCTLSFAVPLRLVAPASRRPSSCLRAAGKATARVHVEGDDPAAKPIRHVASLSMRLSR